MTEMTTRDIFRAFGKALDFDEKNGTSNHPKSIPYFWLSHHPANYEQMMEAAYEFFRFHGVSFTVDYNPEEVDLEALLKLAAIRKEAGDAR